MGRHIITIENVCGKFDSLIASSANSDGVKRLLVRTKITPCYTDNTFVVQTKTDEKEISNIDYAIKYYNELP